MGREFSYQIVRHGVAGDERWAPELRNGWDGPVSFGDEAITRDQLWEWAQECMRQFSIQGWDEYRDGFTSFVVAGEILSNMNPGDTVIINYS